MEQQEQNRIDQAATLNRVRAVYAVVFAAISSTCCYEILLMAASTDDVVFTIHKIFFHHFTYDQVKLRGGWFKFS